MKLNNLLDFSDFWKNWNPEKQKKTKRTDTGKDIIKESVDLLGIQYMRESGLLSIEWGGQFVEFSQENIDGLKSVLNNGGAYTNNHLNPKIEIKKVSFDRINIHTVYTHDKMIDEPPVSINLSQEDVIEILDDAKNYDLASEQDFM